MLSGCMIEPRTGGSTVGMNQANIMLLNELPGFLDQMSPALKVEARCLPAQ
jgi:hypothetical protein